MSDISATPDNTAALTVREGFGSSEVTSIGDIATTASAAAVQAEIQTRAILAERHPRKLEVYRNQLLHYCQHPGFAEQALYCRKVGRKKNETTGEWEDAFAINFSIRFIEAALALYRNIFTVSRIVFEDGNRVLLNVSVTDLEGNTGFSQDCMIAKVVERRDAKDRTVLKERWTSDNHRVYLVEATKDEIRNLMGAERSKLIRDQGQKLMPYHILAEARALIDATNANEQAKDPDAAKKKILDRFASVGVPPDALMNYLDRPLEALTPTDLAELAVLFNSLKDGEVVWADVVRMKSAPAEGEDAKKPDPKSTKLKERIMEARQKVRKPAAEPPTEAS